MEMTGYTIIGYEGRLEPIEAIRELFENSEKEDASRIEIKITPTLMTFTDNGTGCDDPNLMVTPSFSRSRYDLKGTGSKGQGGKEAMATFGRTWEVHSVTRKGRDVAAFRHHKITWDPDGPLPFQYEDNPKAANLAPADIRKGGTRIVVTDRQEGFPRLTANRMEKWCQSLEKTYRPALKSGKLTVTMTNPDIAFRQQLRNPAFDHGKFVSPPDEFTIKVAERPITVRYGVLKEADDTLSGVHYILGPRVIDHAMAINGHSLPIRCYIDVVLDPTWKPLLSTNKDRVRYRDEIDDAVLEKLKSWLEAQQKAAASFQIQIQLGKAAAPINKVIAMLNQEKEGKWQAKPNEKRSNVERKPRKPTITTTEPQTYSGRRRQAIVGEGFGVKKIDRTDRCLDLKVIGDDLGRHLYRPTIIPSQGVAEIRININSESQPGMEETIQNRRDEITNIIAWAYADTASLDPESFVSLFDALRSRGYDIDESTKPQDIRNMVGNFFVAELAKQKPGRLRRVV
jgi:hypothetical protein